MLITCDANHEHASVAAAHGCEQRAREARQRSARQVFHTGAAATPAQLSYIVSLGGDGTQQMTRAEASSVIDQLKRLKGTRPVSQPAPWQPPFPPAMLAMLDEGNYAVRLSEDEAFTFFRVTRPTARNSIFKGCTLIQTRHSEQLITRLTVYPDGDSRRWRFNQVRRFEGHDLLEFIPVMIANQRQCGLDYGQMLGHCFRCDKKLTDDRSRWYGFGPECEKHLPIHKGIVEDVKGEYVPGVTIAQ